MIKYKEPSNADSEYKLLRAISHEYIKAEITCILSEQKNSKEFTNLLTVIELVPVEQEDSPPIGDQKFPYNIRETEDDLTLYVIRIPDLPVAELVKLYETAENGIQLNHKGIKALVKMPYILDQNPPAGNCLLIDPRTDRSIGRILPHRNTNCRVWSKLNTDKHWLEDFDQKFFSRLSSLSMKYLGSDLSKIPEHIGNVYLFGCNPLLRSWDGQLLDFDRDLLVNFYSREAKSIVGCKLILEEDRGKNIGFFIEHAITSSKERIQLPYFPDALHTSIIDPAGCLIDYSFGAWRNFGFTLSVQETVVEYKVMTASGEQIFSVPKRSSEKEVKVGDYDLTTAHYLQNALRSRKFEDLEASKEFIFFPKQPDSKAKARQVVSELLNKARKRCMILDPYFGAGDLVYVFRIENISIPIQIISSSYHLNTRPKPVVQDEPNKYLKLWRHVRHVFFNKPQKLGKTYLEMLFEGIQEYRSKFPLQKIECKILRGSPSPMHDRFIVIDDDVYLLGSSLNQFGDRTTTIIKVPAPEGMIAHSQEWWNDEEFCPAIEEYVLTRKGDDDI